VSGADLKALSSQVNSRERLARFIVALHADLVADPQSWQNVNLESFLEAMSGWVEDMEGYYRNAGEPFDGTLSWSMVAQILLAAKSYE
jgi:hypothetical protein